MRRRWRNRFLVTSLFAMSSLVCRFAPSPNGYLHLGHALSAMMNFDLARAAGGRLLLRIEDIDSARCRSELETAIYEDLAWLGIAWDGPVWRQSEHLDEYRTALARLEADGLVYPSFESRAEIAALVSAAPGTWPRDPDGAPLYPGTSRALSRSERARRIAAGEPYALRLDMEAALARAGARALAWNEAGSGPDGETGAVLAAPASWGDVVLGRKEAPTSYHLAVVIDDARQGVSHVMRGRDLFWSTSVHRLLQVLMDLPMPVYHHHRLVLDAAGRKLSKSTQATALRKLRQDGVAAADIRRMVGLE
jgi:glutamyl-Q tRNA(Asp) synthetase